MANNRGNARIDYYGTDEVIQKFDRVGIDVVKVLADVLKQSAEKLKKEMLDFIKQSHRHPDKKTGKIRDYKKTGKTEDSFIEQIKTDENTGKIYYSIGFNLDGNKPGLPALFLNYGTPTQEPYYFIDNAINENIDEIKRTQEEAFEKIMKDVGLK